MKISGLTLGRLASVLAGAGMLALATALPAQAASYFRMHEGSDYVGVAANRHWVEVCDMERDGNGVYASFWTREEGYVGDVGDGNGSAGGCGNRTFPGTVIAVELCEQPGEICSYSQVPR
ncbi:hypothetical protein [Streptomyces sp. NBC_00878]|uniref:hypothetical protein n=1 Tax=Streptomyces sp. NBC_00878 TaxID=2975854 RepID=UPI0022557F77|nr:hypothetical protein [Streptomyces sp. NBC_00878]MCX4906226.1 hypothetical protein [Streptomyces sp. NBC_00878]